MSGKTESKARLVGIIYNIVTTFLVIVLAAVMVLEFATPYKPSNGFKKVVVDQEQTEQLPNDDDKEKDEKPNDGKEDPTKDPEQGENPNEGENPDPEEPAQNPEPSAQSFALLISGEENFDFEVLPISEWANEELDTKGAQSFYRVALQSANYHHVAFSIRSKEGTELFRNDPYSAEIGTWEFDEYVVCNLSDVSCDIIVLKPFDFIIWVVDINEMATSTLFAEFDRMEIKCAYYAESTEE